MKESSGKIYFRALLELHDIAVLASKFSTVSVRQKSEPGHGSPCFKTAKFIKRNFKREEIVKIVEKATGDFVVYGEHRVFRFWADKK
jgi:hypothetical protein